MCLSEEVRPTVKDIARHAGVSPATVSLVLRNSPLVAETTRAGVQSSIHSLGYVYDRAAANLRARLTHTVGLVICEITNPFYAALAAGVDNALDQAGWVAFVANTSESPERQSRFIARMREHRVDGILLAPAEGTSPSSINELGRQGLPVVQMLRRVGQHNGDYVSADFRLGMALAAEHLIRLGHRRIAFIGGGRRVTPARDRAEAFREILPRFGLPVGPIVKCMPTREGGASAIEELFRTKARRRPRCSATTISARSAPCLASLIEVWFPVAMSPSSASTTSPKPPCIVRRSPLSPSARGRSARKPPVFSCAASSRRKHRLRALFCRLSLLFDRAAEAERRNRFGPASGLEPNREERRR